MKCDLYDKAQDLFITQQDGSAKVGDDFSGWFKIGEKRIVLEYKNVVLYPCFWFLE